mmetsp:Transcript_63569/g.71928  ORF Transcript_63569/g.71928 Transcript_63569/m.71928 type:complete len:443 (-) Transcript_63569:63-1391(-)
MSLFRFKILLPVALAILFTPIPTRFGFWKFVFNLHPSLVGLLPCTFTSRDEWGFTPEDLYGGGNGNGYDDGFPSNQEQRTHRNRLWGQTALVTGANAGVGYEVALALARLGVQVTLACRTPAKCQAAAEKIRHDAVFVSRSKQDRGLHDGAKDSTVTTMTIDTSSLKSVQTFCEQFLGRSPGVPLDMLFLNAGIGAIAVLPDGTNELSVDGIEMTFATNVVGHHLLYKLLAPSILIPRDSEEYTPRKTPARIVLTSSSASYDTHYDYKIPPSLETLNGDPIVGMSHYSMSKLAQILWSRELTAQLDAQGTTASAAEDPNSIVYVNAAHPGAVATNIWDAISRNREVAAQTGTTHYKIVDKVVDALMSYLKSLMWTPEEGALTLLYLGTAVEDLQEKNIRGKYFHPQSILVTEHKNVYENEDETNVRQRNMWKFLDELVADYV